MLSQAETQQFEKAYREYESGDRHKAVQELRSLIETSLDPTDQMGLLYHEVLWLMELSAISNARDRLNEFRKLLESFADAPIDQDYLTPQATRTVMACFVEAKLLLAEGNRAEAVASLDDIVSRFPKQLMNFPEIHDHVQLTRGYFSGEPGQWKKAITILESLSPAAEETSFVSYSLGHSWDEHR